MRITGQAAVAGVVAGVVASGLAATPAAAATRAAGPAAVQSRYAELANAATGADLWSRSSIIERPMGSITKVMTAYVVIEAGDLDRVITVPAGITAYDEKYGASTAGLVPGEKLTAKQLLYAMLIPSGCDAAYALADSYGPGLSAFIAKMNATARELGLTKTHFSDFSGLPDPTEYSTYSDARDLVSLGRDAMKLAVFRSIVGLRSYHLAAAGGHYAHTWQTTNLLLGHYPGAVGIKTGSTNAAGYCLLFEAVRGTRTLIGVVLHSSASSDTVAASDAEKMLNWGFSH
jgi:serine-type D-Ala-D-Ala carboxypeptidase (penicillin-binding protein 5/6)